jgi:Bacterial protein of unknown function (DUF922)
MAARRGAVGKRTAWIMAVLMSVGSIWAGCINKPALTPEESAPLTTVINNKVAQFDGIVWSATRPLLWSDFKGPAPSNSGQEGARTVYSLFNGARCTRQIFEFQVITAFLPRQSWVEPVVLRTTAESQRTLRHEQTHFDLAEVYARRMRKYFAELPAPCARTTATLDELAGGFIRDEATTQAQYDEETRNGRLAPKQSEWDHTVAGLLESLAGYVR